MKLILFGAGASYGCSNVSPYCPPLGSTLFDKLQEKYPQAWGQIPNVDRTKFIPNFELGMKELWESGWQGTPVLMRCLADYFAQFRPLPGNTYNKLLERLDSRGALYETYFSTLNYECLLEYTARQYGFSNIGYFSSDSTKQDSFTLWKIHGSCNFLPASVSAAASAVSYTASAITWDGEIKIVDASLVGQFVGKSAFYPAMAVFMEGKPVHSNPGALKHLQKLWQDAVLEVETLGIIGVKPNESDEHIWEPLANTDLKVVIIGDTDAYEQWMNKRRSGKVTKIVGDNFLNNIDKFISEYTS